MKSLIKRDDLELEVIHNGREVSSFEGEDVIKELVKEEFSKPISVINVVERKSKNIESISHRLKKLKPGDRNYVRAVLWKRIKNLGFEIIYNIKDRKIYEEYRQSNQKCSWD